LTFTGAQASKTVTVATVNDLAVESAETFKMSLSNPGNGSGLGTPNTVTTTINDNDSGGVCSGVSFSVSDASEVEGGPLIFTVAKAGSTSSSCTVTYTTADGTVATAPTYYTAKSGTLTFSSTQTSQTVSVLTVDHERLNATLKMYLNLTSAPNGASISDSQGIGSILASGGGCINCLQGADPGTSSTDPSAQPPPDASE
jgi:hypothetical protein